MRTERKSDTRLPTARRTGTTRCSRDPSRFSVEFLSRLSIIPFGPISRGEDYLRVIEKRYGEFCESLKNEYRFRDVYVENPNSYFRKIQDLLYGDGTNLRKFKKEHFPSIRLVIQRELNNLRKTENLKIVFLLHEGTPSVKVFHYSADYNHWLEIGCKPLT